MTQRARNKNDKKQNKTRKGKESKKCLLTVLALFPYPVVPTPALPLPEVLGWMTETDLILAEEPAEGERLPPSNGEFKRPAESAP
jgi:hypothetical protein